MYAVAPVTPPGVCYSSVTPPDAFAVAPVTPPGVCYSSVTPPDAFAVAPVTPPGVCCSSCYTSRCFRCGLCYCVSIPPDLFVLMGFGGASSLDYTGFPLALSSFSPIGLLRVWR